VALDQKLQGSRYCRRGALQISKSGQVAVIYVVPKSSPIRGSPKI